MKPTSVNLTNKLKVFSSSTQYNLTCIVAGSVPDTEIRWTQNNRPFKRGMVSLVQGNQSGMTLALARRVSSHCHIYDFPLTIWYPALVPTHTRSRTHSVQSVGTFLIDFTLFYFCLLQQLSTSQGNGRVISTLSFYPQPEDDGTMLKCEGSNPRLQNSAIEDSLMLNVICKWS